MKSTIDFEKLILWRKERFLSQEQLADKAGISLRTLQRIENGQTASNGSIHSLADALDVNVNDFILDEGQKLHKSSDLQNAKSLKGLILSFGIHVISFVIGFVTMLLIDLVDNPAQWWSIGPLAFWVIGLFAHGATVLLVWFIQKMSKDIQNLEIAE